MRMDINTNTTMFSEITNQWYVLEAMNQLDNYFKLVILMWELLLCEQTQHNVKGQDQFTHHVPISYDICVMTWYVYDDVDKMKITNGHYHDLSFSDQVTCCCSLPARYVGDWTLMEQDWTLVQVMLPCRIEAVRSTPWGVCVCARMCTLLLLPDMV